MSIVNSINCHEEPILDSTNDVAAPGSNAAATITYAAGGAGVQHVISGIAWSFSATPAAATNLSIQDGSGNTVFSIDITSAGAGVVNFSPPKKGTANSQMIITLAAGGSGVTGKLSVLGHWTEGPNP
jgi:hypothetical protein